MSCAPGMGMTGQRILCAIDFSDGARAALRVAGELAAEQQAPLELVYVEEPPLWQHEPAVHLPGDVHAAERERARGELEAWRLEARAVGAPVVTATLTTGTPWDRITAMARDDRSIGLIVVGTHGRTGLSRAVIGSVAERVVRHAPCSVLVAR